MRKNHESATAVKGESDPVSILPRKAVIEDEPPHDGTSGGWP
ncbi:hypothetical protein [Furfurilactobacillus siliginis]|nr:hypothetical protein [Furfurilactobacillus siliginis]